MLGKMSDDEIDRLLQEQTVGHLGCSAEGRTYVVPMSYVYEDGVVYGHTREGAKLQIIRLNPEVCLQVESIASSSSWRSVIVWGRFEILDRDEGADAMHRLLRHLEPRLAAGKPRETVLEQLVALALASGVAYQIKVREKTGRFER